MTGRDEEPRREKPRDLYPEWTSRTHALKEDAPAVRDSSVGGRFPQVASGGRPAVRPRGALPSTRASIAILMGLLAVAGAFVVLKATGFLHGVSRKAPIAAPSQSADAEIGKAARLRLANESAFSDLRLGVSVRDEVIVVTGPVPDVETRKKLLDFLAMTPGAKGVVDHTAIGDAPLEEPRVEKPFDPRRPLPPTAR